MQKWSDDSDKHKERHVYVFNILELVYNVFISSHV